MNYFVLTIEPFDTFFSIPDSKRVFNIKVDTSLKGELLDIVEKGDILIVNREAPIDRANIVLKKVNNENNSYQKMLEVEKGAKISDLDFFSSQDQLIKITEDDYQCIVARMVNSLDSFTLDDLVKIDNPEPDVDIQDTSISEKYDKDDFLSEIFMTAEQYDKLRDLVMYKKNVILQGAPGVGKTFIAKRFAYSIIGEKNDTFIAMVQFHQNYSYEDFIMGYKPHDNGFRLEEGVFYDFCKKAKDDKNKEHKYFFIIDEINRGQLGKIFGELLMLIENDKRGDDYAVSLAYKHDETFSIPENVYLIGMMNTADRSIAMLDYALRRRFSFYEIEPAFGNEDFKDYLSIIAGQKIADKVVKRLSDLNKMISDEGKSGLGKGFCIGHSYFCIPPIDGQNSEDWYNSIIEYEIAPLLYEYWWDDPTTAENNIKKLLDD